MLTSYLDNSYRWLINPYRFLDDQFKENGLTFWVRLPILGKALFTGDPAMIREIADTPHLQAGKGAYVIRRFLGNESLITLDGDRYRQRRRIIAPLFRRALPAHDAAHIKAIESVLGEMPHHQAFSMYDALRKISLRAIVPILFGAVSSQEQAFVEPLVEEFLSSLRNPLVLFLRPLHLNLGRFTPWGRAIRSQEELRGYIIGKINRARQPNAEGGLLADLIAMSEDLDDKAIVDEILALLMFGHDTSAATMAWAFAHFYQNGSIVERIRDEAARADGEMGLEAKQHVFLSACLEESMRLCPVVAHITRVATQECKIGGHAVAPGTRVIPCTYLAHHNPLVFPNPNLFDSERFLNLNGADFAHSYFPFGLAERTCIGKPFALRQMVLVMATIIRTVRLELAPGYDCAPERQMLLVVPRRGTQMVRLQ